MRGSQQLLLRRLLQHAQTELSGAAGARSAPPWSPPCWVTSGAPAVTPSATSCLLHTTAAPALRSSAAPAIKMAGAPIPLTTGRCAGRGSSVQEARASEGERRR